MSSTKPFPSKNVNDTNDLSLAAIFSSPSYFDISKYTKSTFGMYRGEEEKVEMVFHNHVLDVIIDKFGKDAWLQKVDETHTKITATVSVSPQFFSWVFGLRNYITIVGPENIVEEMKKMLADVSKRYQ